jgi:hypothetical protein
MSIPFHFFATGNSFAASRHWLVGVRWRGFQMSFRQQLFDRSGEHSPGESPGLAQMHSDILRLERPGPKEVTQTMCCRILMIAASFYFEKIW